MSTSLIVIFGKPGAGKSFIAERLYRLHGYAIYNGDEAIPENMRTQLIQKKTITDDMRTHFLANFIAQVQEKITHHDKLVVHQTLLKAFMQQTFFDAFPFAVYILVNTDEQKREQRYATRAYFNLGIPYLRQMTRLFEKPTIPHIPFTNDQDGTKSVDAFLQKITAKLKS